jgi:hypothetical protein
MKYGMVVAAVFFASSALASGNGFAEGSLKPEAMARVNIPAVAKQAVEISVRGNGGDLDCYLYHGREPGQPFGKFITRDTSDKDGCVLKVLPDKDETYLLLVQNTSNHVERYVVTTR